MTIKEIKAAMEKAIAELEALEDKSRVTDLSAEDLKVVTTGVDTKKAEIKSLATQAEDAVTKAKSDKHLSDIMGDLAGLMEVDTANKNLSGADPNADDDDPFGTKRLHAEAIDHTRKVIEHQKAFHTYMTKGMKEVSGEQMKHLLQPKSDRFNEGKSGVVMPDTFGLRVFGKTWADNMGLKALPMQSDSNAQGGYAVPTEQWSFILETPAEEPHILNRASVHPTKTGDIQVPRLQQTDSNEYGGMAAQWTSEGDTKPSTEWAFEQVTIATHELAAYTELTHRLLARSPIDLERFLANLARGVLNDTMDQAFINGTGTGQPLGILQTTGIRLVPRNTRADVKYDDLVDLKYAVKPYHRTNGIFMIGDDVSQNLEKDKDGQNRPLFTASTANGLYDRLVGKSYLPTTRVPRLGRQGDMSFGDMKSYYIAMEQEIVIRRSDDYQFPKNTAAFAFFVVVGGQLVFPRTWATLDDITS